MLAQRLAELASANAEGLLECVTLTNAIINLRLKHKLATTNIGCSARTYLNDLVAQQCLRRTLSSLPLVQVDLAVLRVSVAFRFYLQFADTLSQPLGVTILSVRLPCNLKGPYLPLCLVFSGGRLVEGITLPTLTRSRAIRQVYSPQARIHRMLSHAASFK